ncbi:hypothetical protein UVI_02007580 [Ustilaginoidea virens]|uniref:Peptidase A1 domain-containing protein n=1 Tax=Ustilaginoidea virens TaxID=1159556 RepID=A0A1B5KXU7_USTVR|nr:hypothetical protein UVI_02007580 [Ustilaginoidea virens]
MLVVTALLHGLVALLASAETGTRSQTPEPPLAWDLSKPLNGFTFQRAKALSSPSNDGRTTRFSRLVGIKGQSSNALAVSGLGSMLRTPPSHGQHTYQNISTAGNFSTQYAIECGWDGVPVWLILDTGSSDTWTVEESFECHDGRGAKHGQEECGFGRPHIKSFRGGPIDGLHFHLKYGSGEKVSGPMGYSDIACGGISVSGQQAGLANYTYWHGNNMTVGILGLAYPALTSAYYGETGHEAAWNAIQYVPFLTNAIMQGSMDPVFSVALLKNSSDGIIGWGGLPPVKADTSNYAATDLIVVRCDGSTSCFSRLATGACACCRVKWMRD